MPRQVALSEMTAGETGTVAAIHGGRGIHQRLQSLGIRPGVQVTKVTGSFAAGPIVVGHGQTQTALGRGICHKVLVDIP